MIVLCNLPLSCHLSLGISIRTSELVLVSTTFE
jgi:hypothetical protein